MLFDFSKISLALLIITFLSFFSPFSGYLYSSPHNVQRLMQITLLAISSSLIVVRYFRYGMPIVRENFFSSWILLFITLGAMSSLFSFSFRHSSFEVANFVLSLFVAASFANDMSKNFGNKIDIVLKISSYVCFIYILNVVFFYCFSVISGFQPRVEDFTPGFSNIRFFSHAQTITLPFLIAVLITDCNDKQYRPLWFFVASAWWALLFINGGRGTMLGMLAACVISVLIRKKYAVNFCRGVVLTASAGIVLYVAICFLIPVACGLQPFGMFQGLVQRTAANPVSDRFILWNHAFELVWEHPWLGIGPMHFAHAMFNLKRNAHPHNWVLQIASEWGLPALLCLCLGLLSALRRLIRAGRLISNDDVRNQNLLVIWIGCAAAILTDGMFSGLIVMPVSQMLILLYLGCATGWCWSVEPTNLPILMPKSSFMDHVMLISILSSIYFLVNGIFPEIESVIHPRASFGSDIIFWPRVWEDGLF